MLNIGMTELLCFAIIALLVLGPEKLPEGARFAAKWYGKFKRLISSVQNEIDRELRLSEFREEVQKEIERITELERRMRQQIDALRGPTAETQSSETQNPETRTAEKPAEQPNTADLKSLNFQFFETSAPPYSRSHLMQHWDALCPASVSQNSTVKLKIAV